MSKVDRSQPIVYAGAFVQMDNEISLYNLLGYHDDKDMRVTPMTIDIYRRIKQHRHNDEESYMHGKVWISYERLAVELAVSRQTISKHVGILEKVGLISVERKYRNNKRNYIITVHKPLNEAQFRAKFPECVERYFDALDALNDDNEGWGA